MDLDKHKDAAASAADRARNAQHGEQRADAGLDKAADA